MATSFIADDGKKSTNSKGPQKPHAWTLFSLEMDKYFTPEQHTS